MGVALDPPEVASGGELVGADQAADGVVLRLRIVQDERHETTAGEHVDMN